MKIKQNTDITTFNTATLGLSMTERVMPEFIREDGGEGLLLPHMGSMRRSELDYYMLGDNKHNFLQHIDIDIDKYSLVYDLEYPREIERIYVGSFCNWSVDYTVGEFELYASNDRENLFSEENKLVYYNNIGKRINNTPRNASDFLFDTDGLAARYIAFRHLKTNAEDGLCRLRNICFYSREFTRSRTFLLDNDLKGSVIEGIVPEICGEFSGRAEYVTDGIALDGFQTLKIRDAELKFTLPKATKIHRLVVIGDGIDSADLNGAECNFEINPLDSGRSIYEATFQNLNSEQYVLKILGDASIDQVIAFCDDRDVAIHTDNIINEDFLGVGVNVIPHNMLEWSRQNGFGAHLMELEKRRIAVAHPQIARFWFQLDWFIMDKEDYYNRRYVFNSTKMQAIYMELDAFKEAGIEIELNINWKVGYWAQSWFAFEDIFNRRNSAPRDLKQFAIACSDCLRELIVNRGYDNIKYLTFYNEANNSHFIGGGDFVIPEELNAIEYYNEMLTLCDEQFKKDGIRHLFKIWATETAGGIDRFEPIEQWMDYFNKNSADRYDYATYHIYRTSYDEAIYYSDIVNKLAGDHPTCVAEFGTYGYGTTPGVDFDFERTNISSVLGFMNNGVSSTLFWMMSGTCIEEHFKLDDDESSFWSFPAAADGGANRVNRRFYELCLLNNYIPRHSKVLKTDASQKGMHTVALRTPDGGYTVVVELDNSGRGGRNVNLKFPENVGKKFYKHVYRLDTEREANAIIPPVCGEFEVEDTLTDRVDCDYALIVYTTLPPIRQVVLDEVEIYVRPGETRQLKAKVIDGEGEIKWSLPDCHYQLGFKGSITPDGVYTADPRFLEINQEGGTVRLEFAVKAELPTGEYAIGIIKVSM